MAVKNGGLERIRKAVAERPGMLAGEVARAVGIDPSSGLLAYARKVGAVHAAGPHRWQRYYPCQLQAAAADAELRAQAVARRAAVKKADWQVKCLRRKAASAALGRARNTRPKQVVSGRATGTFVVKGVRYTIAPPMPDRWAVDSKAVSSDR